MKKAFFLCALFCFNTAKSSKFGEDAHIRFLNQLSKENEEYLKKCRQDAEESKRQEEIKKTKEKNSASMAETDALIAKYQAKKKAALAEKES